MTDSAPPRAIKGFHDVLPADAARYTHVEHTCVDIARRYGFREFRAPILEVLPLFVHSIGADTDIVGKEMYTLDGGSAGTVALRPEGTAGVARAWIEHHLDQQPDAARLYYMGPMFRRERPQKGRLRQFHQFGVEAIGLAGPLIDAEVIALFHDILVRLGVTNTTIQINSLGSPACRPAYREALVAFLDTIPEKELCANCIRRRSTNPLRALDCKVPSCGEQYIDAPRMLDYLDAAAHAHWDGVRTHLDTMALEYEIAPHLVRGLDYYTHTAFEILGGDGLGAQNTLAAGGRYDGLIALLGGKSTPAVGGALGVERLLLALDALPQHAAPGRPLVFAVILDDGPGTIRARMLPLVRELRAAGVAVVLDDASGKMKAQMKHADKLGATHTLIFGEDEAARNIIIVRDMEYSQQDEIAFPDVETAALAITRRVTKGYPNITK